MWCDLLKGKTYCSGKHKKINFPLRVIPGNHEGLSVDIFTADLTAASSIHFQLNTQAHICWPARSLTLEMSLTENHFSDKTSTSLINFSTVILKEWQILHIFLVAASIVAVLVPNMVSCSFSEKQKYRNAKTQKYGNILRIPFTGAAVQAGHPANCEDGVQRWPGRHYYGIIIILIKINHDNNYNYNYN